jgi:hypothetical protein
MAVVTSAMALLGAILAIGNLLKRAVSGSFLGIFTLSDLAFTRRNC